MLTREQVLTLLLLEYGFGEVIIDFLEFKGQFVLTLLLLEYGFGVFRLRLLRPH